jgi:hypothetical protein
LYTEHAAGLILYVAKVDGQQFGQRRPSDRFAIVQLVAALARGAREGSCADFNSAVFFNRMDPSQAGRLSLHAGSEPRATRQGTLPNCIQPVADDRRKLQAQQYIEEYVAAGMDFQRKRDVLSGVRISLTTCRRWSRDALLIFATCQTSFKVKNEKSKFDNPLDLGSSERCFNFLSDDL